MPYAPQNLYDYSRSRLPELILRGAETQAGYQRASGERLGNALSNVGQIASEALVQRSEAKKVEKEKEAISKRDTAFMDLLSKSEGMPDPKEVYRIFGPEKTPKIVEGLNAFQQLSQKKGEEAKAQLPGLVRGLNAVGEGSRAALYPSIAKAVAQSGIFPPEQIPPQYSSEAWKGISDFVLGMEKPKEQAPIKVDPGQVVLGPDGKPIYTAVPKPVASPTPHVVGHTLVGNDGKVIYREPDSAKADVTDLSPAGLKMAALNYKKTGTLPPLGMGDKTTRKKIIDMAATLTPEDEAAVMAGGLDIAGNKASYGADSASLKKLQSSRDAMAAFEKTALKNIDVFVDATKKLVDSGSPMLNRPLRAFDSSVLGSDKQAAADAARLVAVNEIAKITNNPNLSGTLSDSARHEVEAFNPRESTLAQTLAVMKLLKQEIRNRSISMDDELSTINKRIRGSGSNPAQSPAPKKKNPFS